MQMVSMPPLADRIESLLDANRETARHPHIFCNRDIR